MQNVVTTKKRLFFLNIFEFMYFTTKKWINNGRMDRGRSLGAISNELKQYPSPSYRSADVTTKDCVCWHRVCVFVYCFHFTAIIDAKVMRWIEKLSNCPLMRAKWKFDFWLVKWYAPSVQCLYLNNRRMICGTWACRMQRPCIIIMICLRPFESTLYSNLLSIYFDIILCVPFVKVTLCVCIPTAAVYQKPYMPKLTEMENALESIPKNEIISNAISHQDDDDIMWFSIS